MAMFVVLTGGYPNRDAAVPRGGIHEQPLDQKARLLATFYS